MISWWISEEWGDNILAIDCGVLAVNTTDGHLKITT
jgi:hypothetical protein